ncbi:MAG TPA: hypothetical protein VJT74_15935 [Pyrinomonadaceae bacterium]|nr:hypothetical protein [Pyrinomonadaceae bacterium]
MKRIIALIFVSALACASALAQQEKGVDSQNERVRDSGNNRTPADNGTKQDNGAGRGMDFGKGRTPVPPPVPNPYRFSVRRDAVVKAVEDAIRERKLVLDTAASKPDEGILISQPYTFAKGAVVATSELGRYAQLTEAQSRGWTRGRYTLIVEIQPIDGNNTNVAVNVKVEGRSDGASGAEWVTMRSTGVAEEEFLSKLVEDLTGAPPPGRLPTTEP